MSSISRNNLKAENRNIWKILSIFSFILFISSVVYLSLNFKSNYNNEEKNFRNDILALAAPMIEEIESTYDYSYSDDDILAASIRPTMESNENIAMVRVWKNSDDIRIAGYRISDKSVAITPIDPLPDLQSKENVEKIWTANNQRWKLHEIDSILNVLNQQQAISDDYDEILKMFENFKNDASVKKNKNSVLMPNILALRSSIYYSQNMLLRNMPVLTKKYPDLLDAQDLMNQSSDTLEMDTEDDFQDGKGYSEEAISIISTVLEKFRVGGIERIDNIKLKNSYLPNPLAIGGNILPQLIGEREFIPITRPAANDNMIELAEVIEIITVRRIGDCLTFWTWQWYLSPIFLIIAIFFSVLSARKRKDVETVQES